MSDATYQNDPDWTNYIERTRSLSKDEMLIREQVVAEYLYDYSWTKACLRCGFQAAFAQDNGIRFSQDPYCIWRVKMLSRERGLNPNPVEHAQHLDNEKQDIINALKKEANYFGPGSSQAARVSALGKLAQLYGMEPPKAVKAEIKGQGVMVVPGIATIDNWEAVAQSAQEKLQADTLNGVKKPNVH